MCRSLWPLPTSLLLVAGPLLEEEGNEGNRRTIPACASWLGDPLYFHTLPQKVSSQCFSFSLSLSRRHVPVLEGRPPPPLETVRGCAAFFLSSVTVDSHR